MPKRRFRRHCVAAGSYVDPSVQIFGFESVRIGKNSVVSEDCVLNASRREAGADVIRIGNNCHIGRRNYFSTGGSIELMDYAFTGMDCVFLGAGHDTSSPLRPYIATGLTRGAPITIGVNTWLTTAVTVHQGVTIGHGSVIGAGAIVKNNLPPFCVAVGSPAVVIKRFDLRSSAWVAISAWTRDMEQAILSERDYLKRLIEADPEISPALHAASRRFGWLP